MRSGNIKLLFVLLAMIGGVLWWQYIRSAPVRQHIEAGLQFLQAGEKEKAENQWLQAVQNDPNSAEAWDLLGDFYLASGKWQLAQDALNRVLVLRPRTAALHTRLATCAFKLGDITKARQDAKAALEANKNDVAALQLAAEIAKNSALHEEQAKYLQSVLEIEPRNVGALLALADEFARRAEYEKSQALVERALKENANLAPAYFLRGLTLFKNSPTVQQLKSAQADFKKVLQLQPQDIQAHRYLARVYLRLNQPALAVRHFEIVGRGRPYASAHLLELSTAYRKLGQVEKSDQLRRLFTLLKQENQQIMEVKDRLDQNANDFANNLQMARLLLKSVTSADAIYHLYAYRYQKGELANVEFYARKALDSQPNNAQAKAQTEALLREIEKSFLAYLSGGESALARKNYQKAAWQFRHAVLLRPDDARLQTALQQLSAFSPPVPETLVP